ncbi:MAG: dienelactone hydrolase family protein [Ktedonobacterales bacterium]
MCFEYDAIPPDLPVSLQSLPLNFSGAASGEDLVLTSADGTQFAAYISRAGSPTGAGMVILPDVRGLYRFYKELADRFATAGVQAIVIDYFGRTAGLAPRNEDFDFMAHTMQTRPETISQDVAAAVAYLRQLPSSAPRSIFTVGFCFGGSNSFSQAANHHGLSGVVGFYGNPVGSRFGAAPIERIAEFECPVLGLFGGADQGIPAEAVQTFDNALTEAGVEHELVIYPGAPHSFFDRRFDEYKEACDDAWIRMLGFISKYTVNISD